MKKPIQKQTTIVKHADDVELRRWCIEKAMHWPITTVHHHAGAMGQYVGQLQQGHTSQQDQDVIARAEKLLQWVTKAQKQ